MQAHQQSWGWSGPREGLLVQSSQETCTQALHALVYPRFAPALVYPSIPLFLTAVARRQLQACCGQNSLELSNFT